MEYEELTKIKESINRKFINGKIELEQKAIKFTDAEAQYRLEAYKYYIDYPEYVNFTGLYENNINEKVAFKMTIVTHIQYDNFLEFSFKKEKVKYKKKFCVDGYVIYIFLFTIEREVFEKKVNLQYKKMLDCKSIHYSFRMKDFQFLLNKTQLKKIFAPVNYCLKGSFARIPHCLYWAINNGDIMSIQNNRLTDVLSGVKPKVNYDLGYVFRSAWESNIARILNYLGIKWEYEKTHIVLKNNAKDDIIYNPDFFLHNNSIIEVKGFWDKVSLEKVYAFKNKQFSFPGHIQNFNKPYLNSELFIIDCDMYYSLEQVYLNILKNWDTPSMKLPITRNVTLVGINIPDRIMYSKILKKNDVVFFIRDKENQFDKNAVRVINKDNNMIGYLAKEWAGIYAEKLDLGMKFNVQVKDIKSNVIVLCVQRSNINEDIIYEFLKPKSELV